VRLRALYRHAVSELELYCEPATSPLAAPVRHAGRVLPPEDPWREQALARLAIGLLALASFGALRLAQQQTRNALLGLGASVAAFCVAISLAPHIGAWLLLGGVLLLSADRLRARTADSRVKGHARLAALTLLSVTAVCAWVNFGHFKYTTALHY
jgi:hypothetical protein